MEIKKKKKKNVVEEEQKEKELEAEVKESNNESDNKPNEVIGKAVDAINVAPKVTLNNTPVFEYDDTDDDSPIAIFGTTITTNKLTAMKKVFKKIYKTSFIDDVFVWHKIDRRTFSDIINTTRSITDEEERIVAREQEFVKAAILYPEMDDNFNNFIESEDIIITGLAEEILYRSGFVPPVTEQV